MDTQMTGNVSHKLDPDQDGRVDYHQFLKTLTETFRYKQPQVRVLWEKLTASIW